MNTLGDHAVDGLRRHRIRQSTWIAAELNELGAHAGQGRVELAIGQCGVCSGNGNTMVCQAVRRLNDGNTLRTAGADPFRVMDAYGAAINFALQAMDACF